MKSTVSRRGFVGAAFATTMLATGVPAFADTAENDVSPDLLRQAKRAFAFHRGRLEHFDRIGIVDFSRPSSSSRFFIVDFATGAAQSHLVAHGRGSDLAHTGWARHFSNEPGSFASSTGAYLTGSEYSGHHGRFMRLCGLDADNCNAESRAIVIHAATYVTPEIVARTGMLGRSEGCFAVSNASLSQVMNRLGPGRLLYASKG